MNEGTSEAQVFFWEEAHPWLSGLSRDPEEDSIDETMRYSLDELRFS